MVKQEFPATPQEAFVSFTDLVYQGYDESVHVRPAPCAWENYKVRVAGVDFGGGDPNAVVPLGITSDWHIHQPDEFYRRGSDAIPDMIAFLQDWHCRAPFDSIECDPSQGATITLMQEFGLPAIAADNRRENILAVGALLSERPPRFSLDSRCTNTRTEYSLYRWRDKADAKFGDRYLTSMPGPRHGDAMDATRYGYAYLQRMGWSYRVAPSAPVYDGVKW